MKLYSYWRSSAAFRVRIGLNLKGLSFDYVPVNIAPGVSEQLGEDYLARNPEGRVPALETGQGLMGQSMAILEWLDETYPQNPFLPSAAWQRAECRAFANTIACDIHPLNNLSVLRKLTDMFGADQAGIKFWYESWILRGFHALEKTAAGRKTEFLFGDRPGLAEICLIPQIWNARRFEVSMTAFPALSETEKTCLELEAFQKALPEKQPDAVN